MLNNVIFPGNRAICKCPPGYTGDPFVRCNADPCSQSPCGINADCESAGNRAVCKCRQGYEVRAELFNWFIASQVWPSLAKPSSLTGNYKIFVWDKQKIFDRKQFKTLESITRLLKEGSRSSNYNYQRNKGFNQKTIYYCLTGSWHLVV